MPNLLTIIHSAFVFIGIAVGTPLQFALLKGKLCYRRCTQFLLATLISDMIGLLFPFDGKVLSIRPLSMISAFMIGVVVVSWKGFHLKGLWRARFAANLTFVLGRGIQIVLYHLLKYWLPIAGLNTLQVDARLALAENIVALVCSALALLSSARFRKEEITSLQNIGE